jgi:hypothetical protein
MELVRAILPMEGVSLGDNLEEQWTLLLAAMKGHRDIIHLIIDPDNRPDIFTAEDLDLGLLACVMIGDLQLTCSLLREGAEPRWNLRESISMWQGHSNSCLRAACTLANVEMVKLLLNNPWCSAQVTTSELRQDLPQYHEQSYELECACQPVRSDDLPDMPAASAEDDARRVEVSRLSWPLMLMLLIADPYMCTYYGTTTIYTCVSQVIRLLVSAGADATDCGLELDPLYLRAFPAATIILSEGDVRHIPPPP